MTFSDLYYCKYRLQKYFKFFDKMVKKRAFLKSYLPLATVLINSDFGISFGAEDSFEDLSMA